MKEHPTLMSTSMVQALLRKDKPKTQTRRVIKPQPTFSPNSGFSYKKYSYGIGSNNWETQQNFI